MPFDALADLDYDALRTYEEVLDELSGKQKPVDGVQALIAQAQKFGG